MRQKTHRVVNIYGEAEVETVDNAIEAELEHGADTKSEALVRICAAYTGVDYREDR